LAVIRTRELTWKESDLYPPLKRFLESQRYEVKGEVLDCDGVAVGTTSPGVLPMAKK